MHLIHIRTFSRAVFAYKSKSTQKYEKHSVLLKYVCEDHPMLILVRKQLSVSESCYPPSVLEKNYTKPASSEKAKYEALALREVGLLLS